MNCKDAEVLLSGLIDSELAAEDRRAIEEHLSICDACRQALNDVRAADALLKEHFPREQPSHYLREKVLERARLAKLELLLEKRPSGWRAVVAAALLAAVVLGVWRWPRPAADDMTRAAILNHINSLSGRLPAEIQNSHPRKVAAWFSGKLPFRIDVPDISPEGYHLVGGRLCQLKGRDVAYIVYKRGDEVVSLFVADFSGIKAPAGHEAMLASLKGYNAACCRKGDIGYIFVSGVDRGRLEAIAKRVGSA